MVKSYQISIDLGYDVRDFSKDTLNLGEFISINYPEVFPHANSQNNSLNSNESLFCASFSKEVCESLKKELEGKNLVKKVYISEID